MFLSEAFIDTHPRLAGLLCLTVLWIPAWILGSLSDPIGCGPWMAGTMVLAGARYLVMPPGWSESLAD